VSVRLHHIECCTLDNGVLEGVGLFLDTAHLINHISKEFLFSLVGGTGMRSFILISLTNTLILFLQSTDILHCHRNIVPERHRCWLQRFLCSMTYYPKITHIIIR
jgi:hypothetical protein